MWVVQANPPLLNAREGDSVHIVQVDVWALGLVYTCARNLVPYGLYPRTVQPVASRYDIFESIRPCGLVYRYQLSGDVTFCILYFSSNSCSTCFGQPCAHHQEQLLEEK